MMTFVVKFFNMIINYSVSVLDYVSDSFDNEEEAETVENYDDNYSVCDAHD
jgi:hypothetical protein